MSLGDSAPSPPTDNVSNSGSGTITILLVAFFVVLIIINGLQYFFGVDIVARLKNVLTGSPEVDITVDTSRAKAAKAPVPEILIRQQVFNIPGNEYIYPDAKALCSAYGARLATYKEIEDSYRDGGEWCNYGWSDGQMALFPTQQASYDKLQKIEGHEHDCGRPGVNGGYIANPNVKFGVNCYGKKPAQTQYEFDMMKSQKGYPINEKDILFQKQVDYWKSKINDLLVSPFNYNSWSKI